jgi:hypothetical protein
MSEVRRGSVEANAPLAPCQRITNTKLAVSSGTNSVGQ